MVLLPLVVLYQDSVLRRVRAVVFQFPANLLLLPFQL